MSTLSDNERIKTESRYLRGTLVESLADTITGALKPDDTQVCKFHGFYQQDDRDVRRDRKDRYQEPAYSFMLRARLPGGVCSPQQWLTLDEITRKLACGNIRLTTRQTFQMHGILKHHLRGVIQGINDAMIDSIGGCGDINRNVMCNPNPHLSHLHSVVYEYAREVSVSLLPKSRAYHEIWLDGEQVAGGEESEPVYGETYLPRKFKVAFAIPPYNDVDVYTNDLGFVAIEENGELLGFNVLAGGGMGVTHGDKASYPRLANLLGFIAPEDAVAVAEAVVTTQRDYGNREQRRYARLKYTVDRIGLDKVRDEIEQRSGVQFSDARPMHFDDRNDRFGWVKGIDDSWHLTLYVENGRVADNGKYKQLTALREIAQIHKGDFRITPNQNLMIAGIHEKDKEKIGELAGAHGLLPEKVSRLRLDSLSCVALPTCPLAMAEAERYYPTFMEKLEQLTSQHGLDNDAINVRISGCPNGCSRPFVAEVALVGKGPGSYNLHIGGSASGERLSGVYKENIREDEILGILDELLGDYALNCDDGERFGDYLVKRGTVRNIGDAKNEFYA